MNKRTEKTNGLTVQQPTELEQAVQGFILDRRAMNVSKGTLHFYNAKLIVFLEFCSALKIERVLEISPSCLREFILHLQEKGHNEGGVFAFYRAVKTLLLWYEDEYEPEHWKNPIRKVSSPKVAIEPLEGISKEAIYKMIGFCDSGSFYGERDKTILLILLETGVRANELLSINLEDIDYTESSILSDMGKVENQEAFSLAEQPENN